MTNGERIGEVTHYFGKISVAVLRLTSDLKIGDTVHFLGRNTDFPQEIQTLKAFSLLDGQEVFKAIAP